MARGAGRKRRTFVVLFVLVAAAAGPVAVGTPLLPLLLDPQHGLLGELVPGLTSGSGTAPSATDPNRFALPAGGGYAGYASGTVLSANVGGLVDFARLNVASADAAFRSGGPARPVTDETGRPAAPALADPGGFARGAALEVTALGGLGLGPLVGTAVEATAPPSREPVSKETGPVALDPLVRAGLLRNQAEARSPSQGCVLGSNLAQGDGQAAGVVIGGSGLGLGVVSTEAAGPRGPLHSSARTVLVPGAYAGPDGPPALALLSEVRQTVAPITFLAGTPAEFTLEFGGEWVLSAQADGRTGAVTFGPEGSGSAPVLRVFGPGGFALAALTAQDLAGPRGQVISVPGVAEISVGEQPRQLLGATGPLPAGAPTAAAAAVDVARIRLLAGGAEVRIGHMEVAVAVPAGGLPCPAPKVVVEAQPASVPAGGEGKLVVSVTNPNDGRLEALDVDLTLSGTPGVTADLVTASAASAAPAPPASGATVRWKGLGPLGPGQSEQLAFTFRPAASSPAGRITADVRALGRYRLASPGPTVVDLPLAATGTGGVDVTRPEPAVVPPPVVEPGAAPGAAPPPVPAPIEAPPTRRPAAATARPRSLPMPSAKVPPSTAPPTTAPPTTVPSAPPEPAAEMPLPELVLVPNVKGLSVPEASARLSQAGFKVMLSEVSDAGPGPAGRVVEQAPAADSLLPPGSTVTLQMRPEGAAPPALHRDGAGWWALGALLLALIIGGLTVRSGRARQRRARRRGAA